MSIKSDKWIKKMSLNENMIEPFSENQVRLDEKGNKLISYGVSSFGYDVRCSNEFKVFTNIHSVTVDPKNFDDNSFIDIQSDVCVIPPNSFALARTVEYFKIPRNVLTICLGKSTYARCRILRAHHSDCPQSWRRTGGVHRGLPTKFDRPGPARSRSVRVCDRRNHTRLRGRHPACDSPGEAPRRDREGWGDRSHRAGFGGCSLHPNQ